MLSSIHNTPGRQKYFPALTGIRAVAAYMVFLHHFNPFGPDFAGGYPFGFLNEFHIGVDIFFVLSGFLIAYRYYDTIRVDFREYMINRVARIYPMYFILTTATFLMLMIPANFTQTNLLLYVTNITFIRGFFDNLKFTGISQGWSLTVEEMFYISAPLIFFLLKRNKLNFIAIPFLLIAFGILLVEIGSRINLYGFFNSFTFMFIYTFFGRCIEFFVGIALALYFMKHSEKRKGVWLTYSGLAVIFLCILSLDLVKGNEEFGIYTDAGVVINNLILPVTGVCVFFMGLLTESTLISKLLGSKLFVLLGQSSYIFYLIHMGFISSDLYALIHNYAIVFTLLNLISVFLFKVMETPLNRMVKSVFAKTESQGK